MDREVTVKKIGEKILYVEGEGSPLATYIITHKADKPCAARKLAELYGKEIAIDPTWNWSDSGVKYAIASVPIEEDLYNKLPHELKKQIQFVSSLETMNWGKARLIKIRDESLNTLVKTSGLRGGTWIRIRGWYADSEKEEFGVTVVEPHKIYSLAESLADLGEVRYRQVMSGWDTDVLEMALYATQTKIHHLAPMPLPLNITNGFMTKALV